MNKRQLKKRYWFFGGLGTGLLGFGLSALVESGFLKHSSAPEWQWILAGTLSLMLVMTGINFLFESFRCKQKLDQDVVGLEE
ncbi:hypothetical protein G3567_03375 [Psychroflexus sp. YR1-1]|uniref:Uncharacterized protein n=1 Tax=Psychroflexus aurantiacus TaxID=2709310 RepID=A0A6B3QZK4_9FLAO|nr:hypothetical protein [Psychroflexus aurantiacus]NEV93188.1 hypothetical protein [Psychroflexus aurantiacus]